MATILHIEDHAGTAMLVKDLLEYNNKDYSVLTAGDGLVGYEMAIAHRPDLIITDMQLPRMSGYELIRELLRSTLFHRVPILIVAVMMGSGYGDQKRWIDLPIQSKPLETRRFHHAVAWLLAWAERQGPIEPSDNPDSYPFYFSRIPDELRAEAYEAGVY